MAYIFSAIQYIMDLGAAIFLPIMITILGLVFGLKFFESLRNGLRIGAGFLGISITLDLLIGGMSPAIEYYSALGEGGFTVTDIGWQGISAIAWSTSYALIFVPIALVLNFILIRLRFTKTMDVDIGDYFHFFLGSSICYYVLKLAGIAEVPAFVIGLLVGIATFIVTLKLADKLAPKWQEHYNLPGTTCCNFDAYYMWAINWVVCKVIDKIPGLNKINLNLKWLNDRFGALGETSVVTFIVGVLLSLLTRQNLTNTLTMSITLSAAIVIMPKVIGLLMEGLVPVSNAARKFFKKRLGDDYEINIGMDQALCLGDPVGIECAAIMIPIAIAISFLPGITMFPLSGLGSLIYFTCACSLFAKGDIFKTLLSTSFCIFYTYEIDSWMAPLITQIGVQAGYISDASTLISGAEVEEFHCVLVALLGKILRAW